MCPIDPTQKQEKKIDAIPAEGIEPEKIPEIEKKISEQIEKEPEEKIREMKEGEIEKAPPPAPAAPAPVADDAELKDIQNVMQENITELYVQMPPAQQKQFRDEGVKTAVAIKGMLMQVKVNVKKITELLKRWLSRLPGINKYFLEQESKIKLDKLLAIKKEKERGGQEQIMD